MELPFTAEAFFAVFAEYNRQFWLVALIWWSASILAVYRARRDPRRHGTLSILLGTLWLWNAVVYHALLFTSINTAAWLFAALFAAEGVLFLRATTGDLRYFAGRGWFSGAGYSLIVYSLLYPVLTVLAGHPYPHVPTFGVPCPTTMLTIGILLTTAEAIPMRLLVIPISWSLLGGSAAFLLGVSTDYVLPIAGGLLALHRLAHAATERVARPVRGTTAHSH